MFKKFLGTMLVFAMLFVASTGFACSGVGCVSATDYSYTTANHNSSSVYGYTQEFATTERGGTANAGTKGFGPASAAVLGSSSDTALGQTGGFGNGTPLAGSYGLSVVNAAGIETASAGRLLGKPTTSTYVNVSGSVFQSNGSTAVSPNGLSWATGGNNSGATFADKNSNTGGSLLGYGASITLNEGFAQAHGGTLMAAGNGYAFGITGSASSTIPEGQAYGLGSMSTQAYAQDGASYGVTQTAGSYCYNGSANGNGFSAGGGKVTVTPGPNSVTVRSVSGQVSYSSGGNLNLNR